MNKYRRKNLEMAFDLTAQAKKILENSKEEEQGAYDNLPDSIRDGERGEEMQNYVEMMEEAYNYLDDAASVIEQI
ncbi:MAG: hypothetical protein LIP10_12265 [Clostridiales bacterium]|nr:hypothetical protein [Clostridiales bacterium]